MTSKTDMHVIRTNMLNEISGVTIEFDNRMRPEFSGFFEAFFVEFLRLSLRSKHHIFPIDSGKASKRYRSVFDGKNGCRTSGFSHIFVL